PNQPLKNIVRILCENSIDLIITDVPEILHHCIMETRIENINELIQNIDKRPDREHTDQQWIKEEKGIVVLSFRCLRLIHVSFGTIISLLANLGKKGLFADKEKETYYVAHVDFTYNYIIGLILPLSHGVTIVIPRDSDITYPGVTLYHPNTIILTGRHFEVLYHTYI